MLFRSTYVVTGGAITVPGTGAWCVGLQYTALFKSASLGDTLSKQKSIDTIAPILYNTHPRGLLVGQDFTTMDNLPLMYKGTPVNVDTIYPRYDSDSECFPGSWSTDTRLCLKAVAPRPCTVLAVVIAGQVT